jgi:ubiquinone/menaquinone biosynthesis C-methylase UbiE
MSRTGLGDVEKAARRNLTARKGCDKVLDRCAGNGADIAPWKRQAGNGFDRQAADGSPESFGGLEKPKGEI